MTVDCPKCGEECEGENVCGHIGYDNYECECGLEFAYDEYSSRYYDMNGNEIKEEANNESA